MVKMKKTYNRLLFALIGTILGVLICIGFSLVRNNSSDAYVYISEDVRAAPKYTDIKMFDCSWCHRTKNLNRHHIIPQSADPSLKNDYSNMIILCRDCHFVLGHKCNWKKFNPDVKEIVETYTNIIVSSEYAACLNNL